MLLYTLFAVCAAQLAQGRDLLADYRGPVQRPATTIFSVPAYHNTPSGGFGTFGNDIIARGADDRVVAYGPTTSREAINNTLGARSNSLGFTIGGTACIVRSVQTSSTLVNSSVYDERHFFDAAVPLPALVVPGSECTTTSCERIIIGTQPVGHYAINTSSSSSTRQWFAATNDFYAAGSPGGGE